MIPKNLLPEGLDWFIAGGYAAVPALAQDIDVWVLTRTPVETRRQILLHLQKEGLTLWTEEQDNPAEKMEVYDHFCTVLKVANVRPSGWMPSIHIVVTDAESVGEVLDGFDISTHQIAIHPERGVVRGQHWTSPIDPPFAFRANVNTPKRMKKIAERYGHPIRTFTEDEVIRS